MNYEKDPMLSAFDKNMLLFFDERDTNLCYKIEDGELNLTYLTGPRALNQYPEGFVPFKKEGTEKILSVLDDGYIFSIPISKKLKTNLFDLASPKIKYSIQTQLFNHALGFTEVPELIRMKCFFIPKKVNLKDYELLFAYEYSKKLSGREIYNILNEIPLIGHYNNDTLKAFKKAFAYLDNMVSVIEESNPSANALQNVQQHILNKKEKLITNFLQKNTTFFKKEPNRIWFSSMIRDLAPDSKLENLIKQKENVSLFEIDTWKHATVEVSRHGLYKNYPLDHSISSSQSQNSYKSLLSQFATFIASNDQKEKWNINVEQAHVGIKKNGNYLFSLTHSKKEPDIIRFQKSLKEFLDYLKPSLISKEGNISRIIGEIFDDKQKLKQIMSSVILFNELKDDLPQTNDRKKGNKI